MSCETIASTNDDIGASYWVYWYLYLPWRFVEVEDCVKAVMNCWI